MFKVLAAIALVTPVLAEPKACNGTNEKCNGKDTKGKCDEEMASGCSWDTEIKACDKCHTYTSAATCPDNSWFSWDDAKGCVWAVELGEIGNTNPKHSCHADQRNADLPAGAARCTGPVGSSIALDDTHNEKIGEEIGDAIAGWLIAVIAIGVGIPICICICCMCCMMGIMGKKKQTQVVMVQAPPQQGPVIVG